jgi:chromosomal replication initiation ATPase DnaA
LEKIVSQSVLGCDDFVREIKRMNKTGNQIDKEHNGKSCYEISRYISLPIEKIFEVVCKEYDVDVHTILKSGKGRRDVLTRQITFYLAAKYCVGILTLNKIGKLMGCKNGDVVSNAVKRVKELMEKDNTLFKKLKRLENVLDKGGGR